MTMDPNTQQRGLLDLIGLQKMQPGAQGETGQRFYQRPSFGRFLEALGAGANQLRANPDANYDRNMMARRKAQFERRQMADQQQKVLELAKGYGPRIQALAATSPKDAMQIIGRIEAQKAMPKAPKARATAKDRFGVMRYVDTGEPVFPSVEGMPTRKSEVTSDGMGIITYAEDGTPNVQIIPEMVNVQLDIADRQRVAKGLPANARAAEDKDYSELEVLNNTTASGNEILQMFGKVPGQNGQGDTFTGNLQIGPQGLVMGLVGSVGLGGNAAREISISRDAYNQFITKLVNDTLRLNKGPQTDQDAIRAADEIGRAKTNAAAYSAIERMMKFLERQKASTQKSINIRRDNLGFPQVKFGGKISWEIVK